VERVEAANNSYRPTHCDCEFWENCVFRQKLTPFGAIVAFHAILASSANVSYLLTYLLDLASQSACVNTLTNQAKLYCHATELKSRQLLFRRRHFSWLTTVMRRTFGLTLGLEDKRDRWRHSDVTSVMTSWETTWSVVNISAPASRTALVAGRVMRGGQARWGRTRWRWQSGFRTFPSGRMFPPPIIPPDHE